MSRKPFVPAALLGKLWRCIIEFEMLKEGDRVLYGKYGGTEVKVNGEEVMILRSEDIYAVFE